jgi:hypothetical protein
MKGADTRLVFHRPMSDTGLPTGNINLKGNGSPVSPIDYYVEALSGERLSCARMIVHILAATDVDVGKYGDLAALTNGVLVFYKRNGVKYNWSNGLPIKVNEDWGRWCYDSNDVSIGPTGKTPFWQARWTFKKYGTPSGVVLETGDQIGLRVQDNLSGLAEQTIIVEGYHLGVPSSTWDNILT